LYEASKLKQTTYIPFYSPNKAIAGPRHWSRAETVFN